MGDLLAEFVLDLAAEGWLPHPFVAHLTERCALCGAGVDRAVHDRHFAARHGLGWRAVLTSLSAREVPDNAR